MLAALPSPASAQTPFAPDATSHSASGETVPDGRALESLIQTLENDQSRAEFVKNLKNLLEAQRKLQKGDDIATGDNWLARFSTQLRTAVGSVAALGGDIDFRRFAAWIGGIVSDPAARAAVLDGAGKILAILGAGILTHMFVAFALGRARLAIEGRGHNTLPARGLFALLRLALDALPLAAGAGVALALAGFIEPRPGVRLVALALINALVASEALMMLARLILSPHTANLRIVPLGDETAHYLYIWICRIGYVALYGYFALEAALLMGLSRSAYGVLANVLGLIIALLIVVFVLQNRDTFAAQIRGAKDDGQLMALRRPLAAVWHLLAIFYVVALYLVLATRGEGGTAYIVRGTFLTALVLLLVWAADNTVRSLTRRGFNVADELRTRFPGLQSRVNRYTTAITVALRIFVATLAAATILEAWGLEVFAWIASPLGQRIASAAVSIVLIVALALTTWELVSSLIERKLTTTGTGRVSTRALTLLPLARTVLRLILIVLVTLVVLAELGMNITPLLAGAGVIGLAVGFGAQKLVQDVITGWFILMEDTISVGDVVDLDGHSGLVERINIRTIQLRDQQGSVHTIPFSSVTTVKNMTRDFAFYVFDVGVAYKEDTDRVIQILREIDDEMRNDEAFAPMILAPLDVLGVERFDDSAVVIRVRTKTLPIQQWNVGREFNRRMKKAFDANGIEIPYPQRTLHVVNRSDLPTETAIKAFNGD